MNRRTFLGALAAVPLALRAKVPQGTVGGITPATFAFARNVPSVLTYGGVPFIYDHVTASNRYYVVNPNLHVGVATQSIPIGEYGWVSQ